MQALESWWGCDPHGPWWVELQSPAPRPVIAWGALLVGGEATLPLPQGAEANEAIPTLRWRRQAQAQLPTLEAALQWAHAQLQRRAGTSRRASGAADGWSVRLARSQRGRFGRDRSGPELARFHNLRQVRDAARALAGWIGEPAELLPVIEPVSVGDPHPSFTAAQRRVIEHHGAPVVVVAVAGAGKTTTLIARVAHLVERGLLDPDQLLLLSFSRSAVATLRERLSQQRGCEAVDVRTFHSLAHQLRRLDAQLSGTPLASGPPPEALVARVAKLARRRAAEHDADLEAAWRSVDLEAFSNYRGRALAELAWPGERGRLPLTLRARIRPPPDDPRHPNHAALFEDFEALRQQLGWSDFDQSLCDALLALHRAPALRHWARGRWQALIVDEAQDVSPVQHAILDSIFEGRQELMWVGDDDQSIYGFRGAAPGLMGRGPFAHRGRSATPLTLTLPEAFRCRAEMLAAAATLMQRVASRGPLRPHAVRGAGGVLSLDRAMGDHAEARAWLVRVQAQWRRSERWSDQVLLLRRFAQLPPFERIAAQHGVPLRIEGTFPMTRHPAVIEAWSGVALALGDAGASPVQRERAWRRYLTGPLGFTRAHAQQLARALAPHSAQAVELCRRHAPLAPHSERFLRIADAAGDAARAFELAADAPQRWPLPQPAALRNTLTLLQERPQDAHRALQAARGAARADPVSDALLVTSIHRAKGMEWPVVHVPGLNDGTFPCSTDPEERRLAYVAWTRARDALHLYLDARAPFSPFIEEGEVEELVALVQDRLHQSAQRRRVGAAGAADRSLAAVWYRREAAQRFGTSSGGYDAEATSAA